MYLHVGQTQLIPERDILGIFDLDTSGYSRHTRAFFRLAEERGEVINVAEDLPKSFLLCAAGDGSTRIYLSQLSSQTLLRRSKLGSFENHIYPDV